MEKLWKIQPSLALKNGGREAQDKEWGQPVESQKDKKIDSSLELLEQIAVLPTPNTSLVQQFWPFRLMTHVN